jgi:hypothetical protein
MGETGTPGIKQNPCAKKCKIGILTGTLPNYGGTGPPEWPIKKRNQKMEKRFPKTNF